jgi:hypothetical protein
MGGLISLARIFRKQVSGCFQLGGGKGIRSSIARIVEMMDYNVGRQRNRPDSVAAWLTDEHTRGTIEYEQFHSRGSGS